MKEIHQRFPHQRILHLDIHAQGNKKNIPKMDIFASQSRNTIYVGTGNGRTIKSRKQMWGPNGFIGLLQARFRNTKSINKVHPFSATGGEHPAYPGGYVVTTYGHSITGTADSIQLEFGYYQRNIRMASTVNAIAHSLCKYLKKNLADNELSKIPDDATDVENKWRSDLEVKNTAILNENTHEESKLDAIAAAARSMASQPKIDSNINPHAAQALIRA